MGKLDELMKASRGIASESMGVVKRDPAQPAVSAEPDRLQGVVRSRDAADIPVAKIVPDPDQPREEFDPEALERLAESMKARGQLQPIRVRWDAGQGAYVVLVGERRYRAAKMAGLETLSCVIVNTPIEPGELLALQLIENLLRDDLRPIEQAKAFRTLMTRNGWSTRQVAAELAVTQSAVVRALALLDLPEPVQVKVEAGELPPATAYEISKLDDDEARADLVERVAAERLTRAETARAVQQAAKQSKGRGASKAKGRAPRKVTEKVYRTTAGRVTVENRKGLDASTLVAALAEALATARGELDQTEGRDAA
jgi:ParB family chromosome partitioning protein